MAEIKAQDVLGSYASESAIPQLTPIVWTAGSPAGDTIKFTGSRVLVLFRNSGASSRTVAAASALDPYNRKADIPATTLPAGNVMMKVFSPVGWEQATGGKNLEVTVNHAEVMIAAINLP